jgi:hypothetical protein
VDTRPVEWAARTVWPASTSTPRSNRWDIRPAEGFARFVGFDASTDEVSPATARATLFP